MPLALSTRISLRFRLDPSNLRDARQSTDTPLPTATPTPRPITILAPANGTIVHGFPIVVTGQAVGADAVTVNGVVATLTGDSFSASVTLAEGANTVTATATNGAGAVSDTISVTLNTAPILHLITIATNANGAATITGRPGSVIAGGLVTITNTRTAASATVSADESGQFTASLTVQRGDVLTIFATDGVGHVGVVGTLQVSALSVTITDPMAGATVTGDRVTVRGTLQGGAETGVLVNGISAVVDGGTFLVSNVPLTLGENVITAIATNRRGDSASQSVTVVGLAVPAALTLSATQTSGITPLLVTFSYRFSGTARSLSIDFDGDGVDDFSTSDPARPLRYVYQTPGLYLARLRVTDDQSAVSQAVVTIQVASPTTMDEFFQSLWNGMTAALVMGDKETALTYLTVGAQQKYGPVFDVLLPYMPEITASYSPLQRVEISDAIAEYAIKRTIDGRNRIFLIAFLKATDGVWRIDTM